MNSIRCIRFINYHRKQQQQHIYCDIIYYNKKTSLRSLSIITTGTSCHCQQLQPYNNNTVLNQILSFHNSRKEKTCSINNTFYYNNNNNNSNSNVNSKQFSTTILNANNSVITTSILLLSRRQIIHLENYLYNNINIKLYLDNIIKNKTLVELKWCKNKPNITTTTTTNNNNNNNNSIIKINYTLKLPSLLHPKLNELKNNIINKTIEYTKLWLSDNNITILNHDDNNNNNNIIVTIDTIINKPFPIMTQLIIDNNQNNNNNNNTNNNINIDEDEVLNKDMNDELINKLGLGLKNVTHIIAVYSCKGGVGKSTIAVNLACELSNKYGYNGRIGLLDLDLYGPSIPILIQPKDITIRTSPLGIGMVYPIEYNNVKVLSLGYVNQQSGVPGSGSNNGAAIMKGPMAVKVVTQLLKSTDWGDLDVLILDLPPGTGDVQLGVLQEIQLSGAVAVTTPSKLSIADTKKGIEMFTSLGVPTLAVVENMSYFEDDTGKRHHPFGKGFFDGGDDNNNLLKQQKDFINVVQMPISVLTNDANDIGEPLTITRPVTGAEKELNAYKNLADIVSTELLKVHYGFIGEDNMETISFEDDSTLYDVQTTTLALSKQDDKNFIIRIFSDTGAIQKEINPSKLRSSDPRTGDKIIDSPFLDDNNDKDVSLSKSSTNGVTITKTNPKKSPSIIPSTVSRRGRYGFAVVWQDGATIIYSNRCIARCAGGVLKSSDTVVSTEQNMM